MLLLVNFLFKLEGQGQNKMGESRGQDEIRDLSVISSLIFQILSFQLYWLLL